MSDSQPCWLVQIPGREPFPMLGERITRQEAERVARLKWPDAQVIDYIVTGDQGGQNITRA